MRTPSCAPRRPQSLRRSAAGDGERLALAHERYAHAGGYTAQARAMALLAGLGFAQADALRPVREFSGGYRMRLNLGRALVRPSDLLLLDEPTNHLDLDTILWFENWLRGYAGMLLVVSHDRDFLDRVSDHTLAIGNATLRLYAGNYSAYERLQAIELAQQAALAARQSKEVQRITSFVERFRAKASKARQAQSRLKQLERMAEIAPVYAAQSFRIQFEEPERQPERIVALEDVAAGYDDRPVLDGVSMVVARNDRLAVIGANGAGKTTLVRLLAGELAPLAGRRAEGTRHRDRLFRPAPGRDAARRGNTARDDAALVPRRTRAETARLPRSLRLRRGACRKTDRTALRR